MKYLPIILAFLVVLVGPIILRPKQPSSSGAGERRVIIITPHNESIRFEFARGFEKHYLAKTGQRVRVDYRTPGGTSEIGRYLDGGFLAGFENYWRKTLRRPWSESIKRSFGDSKLKLPDNPSSDTPEQAARRAFLASNVGCNIDLFFGGGAYDFQQAAGKGQLVDSGYIAAHPEIFGDGPGKIPQKLSGEPFWDPQGRWVGSVISSFGIISNRDVLARLGIPASPKIWSELADPRYFGEVALANPTQSSSINKAFEMLIQQQMAAVVSERGESPESVAAGWTRALRLLQRICANARYFTDSSTKPSLDVAAGDCAAGMTIDFYARFQAESVSRSGGGYLHYTNAEGGTSVGVDPVGLLRGAPNADIAREFIAFVMSSDGQKLWNWKPGTEGGPEHYALCRQPILPALYGSEFRELRSDPDIFPYEIAQQFVYHDSWTAPLFRAQAVIIRSMGIDTHHDLREAWRALVDTGFPPDAVEVFERMDAVDYSAANKRIRETLGASKIGEVRLAKELADGFRAQYRETVRRARVHGAHAAP
jgi:iron(III) transport system substrate-binding protein